LSVVSLGSWFRFSRGQEPFDFLKDAFDTDFLRESVIFVRLNLVIPTTQAPPGAGDEYPHG